MQYQVFLFDFDGTIADTKNLIVKSMTKTFLKHGLAKPIKEAIIAGMGIPLELEIMRLADNKLTPLENEQMMATFRWYSKELEAEYLALFPDIKEVIIALSAKVKLGIVTSKSGAVVKRQLEMLGLLQYFEAIVSSEMVKNYKPAKDTAILALEMLKLADPHSTLVIGDSTYDILMGKNAAMATCAVTWGAHSKTVLEEVGPTYMVDNPRSLLLLSQELE
ncbi:MAG: HAD family hydrolase [Culicoidibacterales bacterium]